MGDAALAGYLEQLLDSVDEVFALSPDSIAGGHADATAAVRTAAKILGIHDEELTRDQSVVVLRLAAAMMREDALETALRIAREPVVLRSHLQHALVSAHLAHKLMGQGITQEKLAEIYQHVGSVIMNLTEAGVRIESPTTTKETSP